MGYDWDDPSAGTLMPLALAATRRWAHAHLGCAHLEVLARVDPAELAVPPGMSCATFHSFERPLVDDATMLAAMSTNARRNIRRSQRRGVRIEAVGVEQAADFAWESFSQVRDAFLRREVSPSYGPRRTRELLDTMLPGGRLLATRAVTADGRCAGTCISAGTPGGRATFLTGAADAAMLDVRPNEALMWHAMTTWRDRGAQVFDFGGGGTYKQKFGCRPVESAWVRSSLLPGAEPARATARRWYRRVHYLGDHAPSWRQVLAPQGVADAAGRTG
jgi:CelD/BcsL family acetyltransferase involved in cellulose biosynthesis